MFAIVALLLISIFFVAMLSFGIAGAVLWTLISCGIVGTVFWIWMLIDCATNEPSEGCDKIVWILVILFTHGLGALIYLLARRPERKRLYGR